MTEQDKRHKLTEAYIEEIGVTICPAGSAGGTVVEWCAFERFKRILGEGNRQSLPARTRQP